MEISEQKKWQRQMLDAVINDGVNLTQREDEFIESISDRVYSNFILSEAQHKWLEDIYTNRVP